MGASGGARVVAAGFGWRHASRKKATFSNIDLDIPAGQKVLLLGASGSGKSTLLAGIAGVLGSGDDGDHTGSITVDGVDPRTHRGLVGLVLQDPDSQVISSRVGDDVVFGCENLLVDRDTMWRRAHEALDLVGLRLPLDHPTTELSGGQKQRLALAGVIAMGAKVILLDEPTANLDPEGVREVRDAVVDVVANTGATLIVVEHRVDVWADVCDRAIVIGSGDESIIADGQLTQVINRHGVELSEQGVWLPGLHPDLPAARRIDIDASTEIDLWAASLVTGWKKDTPVSAPRDIALPAGHSTVITGPNGSGKSTLALTLAGLLEPLESRVHLAAALAGNAADDPHTLSSMQLARRIGFVFQDPEHQFVARTVREELEVTPAVLAAPRRRLFGKWLGTARRHELGPQHKARIDELLQRLRLEHLADANPFTLSGGQKRRLSVASVLVASPKIVFLDEPTFGQDRRTFSEMVTLLRELADSGVTLCSITHDRLYAEALADHAVVLD